MQPMIYKSSDHDIILNHDNLSVFLPRRLLGLYNVMIMWPNHVIYSNHIVCDLVMWSWYHSYLNRDQVLTYMKVSLILQFYNVKAYLWSTTSRGHGDGFQWKLGICSQLLKPLIYSKPYSKISKPLDVAGSALW